MKFVFSLEPLLQLRDQEEAAQRARLAYLERERLALATQEAELEHQLMQRASTQRSIQSISQLRRAHVSQMKQIHTLATLRKKQLELEQQVWQQQRVVVESAKATMSLQKLKDRKRNEFDQDVQSHEQQQMNEIGILQFNRTQTH